LTQQISCCAEWIALLHERGSHSFICESQCFRRKKRTHFFDRTHWSCFGRVWISHILQQPFTSRLYCVVSRWYSPSCLKTFSLSTSTTLLFFRSRCSLLQNRKVDL
jgi:hypothetical protein